VQDERPAVLEIVDAPEVVPEAERDEWQLDAAAAAAPIEGWV
jgi:hypothetical protein